MKNISAFIRINKYKKIIKVGGIKNKVKQNSLPEVCTT